MENKKIVGYVSYLTAVNWVIRNRVLFNQIHEFDENFWENVPCVESEDGDDWEYPEIYQYYLTDLSDYDVEYLNKTFDLLLAYSEKLDKWVLCVDHFGTSWDYVSCAVYSESWWEINKEKYEYKH